VCKELTEKLVVPDGGCCPVCTPRPTCDGVTCVDPKCTDGTVAQKVDLQCCPVCRPKEGGCETVLCAQPPCDKAYQIKRDGACCPTCAQCTENDPRTSCDDNDDEVCRAGFYKGENCNETVPVADRITVELTVKLCKRPSCQKLTEEELKRVIASLTTLGLEHFTVEYVGVAEDKCCQRYKLIISAEKTENVDVEGAKNQLASALADDQELSIEETQTSNTMEVASEDNSSSSLTISFFVLALIVALL